MDLSLSMEEQLFQESVQRFCRNEYSFPLRRDRLEYGSTSDRTLWRIFAELGWLEAVLPSTSEPAAPLINLVLLMQEFGRALVVEPFLSSAQAAATIQFLGDAEQRRTLLEPMLGGHVVLALAHQELNSFGRISAVSAEAVQTPNGYLLSGDKTLVIDAPGADGFVVSARTFGKPGSVSGVSLFHVPAIAKGISTYEYGLLDGFRACDLRLREVAVPVGALIGPPNAASTTLEFVLDYAVLAVCAEAVGIMDAVTSMTSEYLKSRRQYGVALSSLQALQHRVADQLVETELSRSMLYRALRAFSSPNAAVRQREISACKAHISSSGKFVTSNGIQLHGALGFSNEYVIGHYYKRLTAIACLFGDTDFHLNRYVNLRVKAM